MGFMLALAPLAAGLVGGGLTTALGGGALLGGILPEVVGGAAGALTGGLTQHSALGALEGAVGGAGGGFGGASLASALGAAPLSAAGVSSALPAGGGGVLNPDILTAAPSGAGLDIADRAGNIIATGMPGQLLTAAPSLSNALSAVPPITGAFDQAPAALGAIAPASAATSGLSLALPAGGSGVLNPAFLSSSGGPDLGLQSGGATGAPPAGGSYVPGTTQPVQQPVQQPANVAPGSAGNTSGSPTSAGGLFGSLNSFLKNNSGLLQLALAGGGIGASALERPAIPGVGQPVSGINPQSSLGQEIGTAQDVSAVVPQDVANAQNLQQGATTLVNAPTTGTLPPGMQEMINQALQDTETAIRSRYANLGEAGSTAETQDLAAAQERAQSEAASLLLQTQQAGLSQEAAANNAVSEALNAAGLQDQVYSQIANVQLASDQQLQNAIASVAAGAAGGLGRQAA